MKPLIKYIHFVGLDAPVVAMIWQMIWGNLLSSGLQWFHYVILFTGTWAVYLGDRFLDNSKESEGFAQQQRHDFAGYNRKLIIVLCLLAISICTVTSLLMLRPKGAIGGVVFSLIVGAYLIGIHQRRWAQTALGVKEAGVAVLFACGTAFFPLIWRTTLDIQTLMAFLLFVLLCFENCLFITLWEERKHYPFVEWLICFIPLSISLVCAFLFPAHFLFILVGITAFCLWITAKQIAPAKPLLARVLSDVVLLIPVLWVFTGN
ncbi:MAG: hypothetical protein SGI98_10585 [Verrucomicrobiota bacterium]|nr:hypothetical protein [Verrucomicrobiota bacterium]